MKQLPITKNMTIDDILFGDADIDDYYTPNTSNTRTTLVENIPAKIISRFDFAKLIEKLEDFNNRHLNLFEADRHSLYYTFYIPKSSGGLRKIDAPVPSLMEALRELKSIFEVDFCALYHTAAFAYIKNRCAADSIKRHQNNESKWFLNLDFHNFFGSTTEDFVMSSFSNIFPFSQIVLRTAGRNALKKSLSLCFLDGGLPQGTPISPLITNVMMIPIDHSLFKSLRDFDKRKFVYTRYADDITISCKIDFNKELEIGLVKDTMQKFGAPFELNEAKTRYGSSSGKNWNLGVMLNKDNEITVGYRKKKAFKAMVNNFILDTINGKLWEVHDVQVLYGLFSYYSMIEKPTIEHIVNAFNIKYSVDFEAMAKRQMNTQEG
ncbi:MAG: reverse transcriptase domain-containing protein [Bacteroides sp.]